MTFFLDPKSPTPYNLNPKSALCQVMVPLLVPEDAQPAAASITSTVSYC